MEGLKAVEKERKLVLPPDVDEEIKSDLMKSDCRISIHLTKDDGKIKADCNYDDIKGNYRNFTKFFDNWKQFQTYADKFFALSDE